MTSVSVTSRSTDREIPFTEEFIIELIKENSSTVSPSELISKIAESLQIKSSKHKFIVQFTNIKKKNDFDADLDLLSDYAGVWEQSKDGCITLKVEEDKENESIILLISIYWISV